MLWEGRGHETSAGHAGGLAAQQLGSETCCPGRPVEATSPRDRAWNVPWKLDAAQQVLPPGETPPGLPPPDQPPQGPAPEPGLGQQRGPWAVSHTSTRGTCCSDPSVGCGGKSVGTLSPRHQLQPREDGPRASEHLGLPAVPLALWAPWTREQGWREGQPQTLPGRGWRWHTGACGEGAQGLGAGVGLARRASSSPLWPRPTPGKRRLRGASPWDTVSSASISLKCQAGPTGV